MSEFSANPGEIIRERYRVVRVLGEGGMGMVVEARHIELETPVAIKFLRPEMLGNQELMRRFSREARAAVRIKSEHVARVSDVGTLPSGSPYMVMEFLEGKDLSQLIHPKRPLAVSRVVDFVLQACEAIAEAHKLGIVHRDLKPSNLFLTPRADGSDLIKVLDFGISKQTDASAESAALTGTSAMLGSPSYMSPEQLASSRDVDARTDIWALGVIVYQLLTGRVPFVADTIPELFLTILQRQPPPLSELRKDLPFGLEAVVARCLEKKREQRYQTVAQLSRDLLPFAPTRSTLSVERICRLLGDEEPVEAQRRPVIPMPDQKSAAPTLERDKSASPAAATQQGEPAFDVVTTGESESGEGEPQLRTSTQGAWGQTTRTGRGARGRRTAMLLVGGVLAWGGYWYSRPAGMAPTDELAAGAASGLVAEPTTAVQAVSPGRESPPASAGKQGPAIRIIQSERAGLRAQPSDPQEQELQEQEQRETTPPEPSTAVPPGTAHSRQGVRSRQGVNRVEASSASPAASARRSPRPVAAQRPASAPPSPLPAVKARPKQRSSSAKPKPDDFGWEESRH